MSEKYKGTVPPRSGGWLLALGSLVLLGLGATLWWGMLQKPQTIPQLIDAVMGRQWSMSRQDALAQLKSRQYRPHELAPTLLAQLATCPPQQRPWLLFVISSLTKTPYLKTLASMATAEATSESIAATEAIIHILQRHGVKWLEREDPRLVILLARIIRLRRDAAPALKAMIKRHESALRDALEAPYIRKIQQGNPLWSSKYDKKWRALHGWMHRTLQHMVMSGGDHAPRAMLALGRADAQALPTFRAFLAKDMPLRLKKASLVSLYLMGPAAAPLLPQLQQALAEPQLWTEVLDAIGAIGPAASSAAPKLISLLGQPKHQCDRALLKAIGKIGPKAKQAIPLIMSCATRTRFPPNKRKGMILAWRILGQLKAHPKRLIPRLHRLLLQEARKMRAKPRSTSWDTVYAYIGALGQYGALAAPALRTMLLFLKHPADPKEKGYFRKHYATHQQRAARQAVVEALAGMGPAAAPAIPMLLDLMRNSPWRTQKLLRRTFTKIGATVAFASHIACVRLPDDKPVAISQEGKRWLKLQNQRWSLTYDRLQKRWDKPLLTWAQRTTPTLDLQAILTSDRFARDKALWLHHALATRCGYYTTPKTLQKPYGDKALARLLSVHRSHTPYVQAFRRRILKVMREVSTQKMERPAFFRAVGALFVPATAPRVYADAITTYAALATRQKAHQDLLKQRWQQAFVHNAPIVNQAAGDLLNRDEGLARMVLPSLTSALSHDDAAQRRLILERLARARVRSSHLFNPIYKRTQVEPVPQLKQRAMSLLFDTREPASTSPQQHEMLLDLILKRLSTAATGPKVISLIKTMSYRYHRWSKALRKPTPLATRQRIFRRLMPHLKGTEPKIIKAAFVALRRIGLTKDMDLRALQQVVDNQAAETTLRLKAVDGLLAYGKEAVPALPFVIATMKQKRHRLKALSLLGRLYPFQKDSKPLFQAIEAAYQQTSNRLGRQAFALLCRYDAKDRRPLPWLIKAIRTSTHQECYEALGALQRRSEYEADNPQVVDALFALLDSTKPLPTKPLPKGRYSELLNINTAWSRRLDLALSQGMGLGLSAPSTHSIYQKTINVLIAYGREGKLVLKKALLKLQQTHHLSLQRACLKILAAQGARARFAAPTIIKFLRTNNDNIRRQALKALQQLKVPSSQLLLPLLSLLSPRYKATHKRSLALLRPMTPKGPRAQRTLIRLLRAKQADHRALAITLLMRMAGVDIRRQLTLMARLDPSPKVRRQAALALQRQRDAQASPQRKSP